jgi:hypothetical protein
MNNLDFYFYCVCRSGVFTDNSCGKCPRNHAVVAVGYGTLNNIPYWVFLLIIKTFALETLKCVIVFM